MRARTCAAGVVALLVAAACGDSSDDGPRTADGRAGDAAEEADVAEHRADDVEREAAAGDAPVDELVTGLRAFTVDFAGQVSDEGNLVFSPTSIGLAFAMAEAGADEATAERITEAFGFPEGTGLHEAVNALTQALEAANHEDVIVEPASATWVQDGVEVGRPFLETMAAYYGAGVETTDFAGDAAGGRERINDWVAERTRDRITDLLDADAVTPDTVTVLVNAIYLKAAWEDPFLVGATGDEPFHRADGSTVDVPTMHNATLETRVGRGDLAGAAYTAVELPYEGGDLSMLVVVPDEGTALAGLEAGLDGPGLGRIGDDLAPAVVDLRLPRWDLTSELDLAGSLAALGVPIPGGDLSGIAPGVVLDAAVHAADITVDEEGTEAAAATAAMGITSAPVFDDVLTVTVDRPFLFLVQHTGTGAPLFYGRVADPAG